MTGLILSAFAAGLVATVNPCGFAMLPAYLSFFLELGDTGTRPVGRAFRVAGVITMSFLAVFGLAGLLLAIGLQAVIGAVPWIALVVGLGLVALGVWVLRGHVIAVSLPGRGRVDRRSVFLFGASYAIASLSCTLPIFLSLVVGTIATASVAGSVVLFLTYGLGMALVIGAITVGLAIGQDWLVRFIKGSARWMPVVSGSMLIVAGAFIVWYWGTFLGSGAVALGQFGIVRWVDSLSAAISNFVADNIWFVVAVLLLLTVAGAVALRRVRRSGQATRSDDQTTVSV